MRSLTIPYVTLPAEALTAIKVTTLVTASAFETIAEQPWPSFTYKPDVKFSIAHTGEHIVLTFNVEETEVRDVNTAIISSVGDDSCVVFFICFVERGYYNFEFYLINYFKNFR